MGKYSRVSNNWGEVFGLSPQDLTPNQMMSIKFEKLIEFLTIDPRAEYIASARIFREEPSKLQYFSHLSEDEVLSCPRLLEAYNRYIRVNRAKIDTTNRKSLIWHMLDEENREYEIQRWSVNRESIIKDHNIDYEWLAEKHPEKIENKIEHYKKRLKEDEHYTYAWGWEGVKHAISKAPSPYIDQIGDILFDKKNRKKNKELQLQTLENKHLSSKHAALALKVGAKRLYWPKIKAKITKDILEQLPTVTRLEALEKLVRHRVPIHGLEDESDFKALMLAAMMRHPERVERVARMYKNIKPIEPPKFGDN